MRILLVSEGKHELGGVERRGALIALVSRLIAVPVSIDARDVRSPTVRIHARKGKGDGMWKRAVAWLRAAEHESFDALVLVIDRDDEQERIKQIDRAQDCLEFSIARAMGIAIRAFDAWMIADEEAMSAALDYTVLRSPEPESLSDPKSDCHQHLKKAGADFSLTTLYEEVAKRAKIEVLEARCPKGFAPFAKRTRWLGAQDSQASR